jgi:uncharacterized repeat protein (TIGR01451 family)
MKKLITVIVLFFLSVVSYGNITDTEPPVWTSPLPPDITVECNNIPSPGNLYASDNSGTATVTFNYQTIEGMCPGNYTILHIWTATDPSGNSISHTQTITVIDLSSPLINGNYPLNATVTSNSIPPVPNLEFIDNCGVPSVTFSETNSSIDANGIYTILRIWTATDQCGNQSTYIQIITVVPITFTVTTDYVDVDNNGFVSVGDAIEYEYAISNNTNNSFTNINLTGENVTTSGGPIANLLPLSTDSTTFTGVHLLTQQDITSGFLEVTTTVTGILNGTTLTFEKTTSTVLNQSNGIKMVAYVDSNNNNQFDSNEAVESIGQFTYQINGGDVHYLYSNNGSVILYESNPSNNYSLSYVVGLPFTSQYNLLTPTYNNVTVANNSGITTYYFALTEFPFTDLATFCSSINSPRPGFTYQNRVTIRNSGNQTISAGTLNFSKDPNVSIVSISESAVISTPTGFTYNFTNLLPDNYIAITVVMQVPTIPTVSLGQLLTNTASVTVPNGDINPNNNTSNLTQVIVGSYDPNDKQESHGGQIEFADFTADDYLTYTIRFENTGTAEAINVRVEDVLDNQLDETTLQMIDASHDYVLRRIGNELTWEFDGINLPPSIPNSQIGHGFITFQIKPKAGYAIGDIIPNTAEIYFDFNPAIITNTTTTEFVETLSNTDVTFSNLNYHPNPVKNSLTVSNNYVIDSVEITSVLGQQMLSQKVNNLQTDIDLSELSKGIYFAKVTSEGQEKTVKIVKE